jgi:hypothetical protein
VVVASAGRGRREVAVVVDVGSSTETGIAAGNGVEGLGLIGVALPVNEEPTVLE